MKSKSRCPWWFSLFNVAPTVCECGLCEHWQLFSLDRNQRRPRNSGRLAEKAHSATQYCWCQTRGSCPLADTSMPACPLSYHNHHYAGFSIIQWLQLVNLHLSHTVKLGFLPSLPLSGSRLLPHLSLFFVISCMHTNILAATVWAGYVTVPKWHLSAAQTQLFRSHWLTLHFSVFLFKFPVKFYTRLLYWPNVKVVWHEEIKGKKTKLPVYCTSIYCWLQYDDYCSHKLWYLFSNIPAWKSQATYPVCLFFLWFSSKSEFLYIIWLPQ